ncbi:MAG: cell division protein ZapA [Acidobacteriia bacterium]|nr:cell division protein ZapA [Methyloceanibacter sp.]MBX5471905.1 cell division protein ZapA [Acetobacteraceae bacterium]MCL6491161.1 cell division protein ZapA [Terriglobia bacterium]
MAQVTVRINGYAYTVGCEDGQEAHLQAMAQQVDERIERIKAVAGPSGEARLLMLAALLLADELHDLKKAMEAANHNGPESVEAMRSGAVAPELAFKIAALADRAEEIAASFEEP